MARAFLLHTPSAQVRLTDRGNSCVIVTRIPEEEYHNIVSDLAKSAEETEISLEAVPIFAYAGYRNNLYSGILKGDGSWDDDVSGLLDQVRLRSKDTED
jgi:hypothetical protein